jgi:hypothetical protein
VIVKTCENQQVKEQRICVKFCFILVKTISETHRMLKEVFGDNALGQTQTYKWIKRFKNGWMSVHIESVLDDLRPEPRPKMWQKFDIECIALEGFVPPGQTVNGKLYCDVLRPLRENIRPNNSWAQLHDNASTHASLVVRQFLASTNTTVIPTLPAHRTSPPLIFSYSRR